MSAFKFVQGVDPYPDGSGHRATVTVEDADDGIGLSIEIIHRLPIDQWPNLRAAIDDLVALAEKRR